MLGEDSEASGVLASTSPGLGAAWLVGGDGGSGILAGNNPDLGQSLDEVGDGEVSEASGVLAGTSTELGAGCLVGGGGGSGVLAGTSPGLGGRCLACHPLLLCPLCTGNKTRAAPGWIPCVDSGT